MDLKLFIDKLQKIYDEAKTSGHTRGDYPPDIIFYLDGLNYDMVELEDFDIDTSNAACCSDVIGATITFRLHERI